MAIKINFDAAHNPEMPTIVLAKRNGDKLGQINAKAIAVSDSMNDGSDITFNVYKYIDGVKCNLWEQIVDFKLIYCVEWDMWFEISVELDESNEIVKTVFCKRLGHAELSQIMLYDIEINTENDIARDDYEIPTVLYNTQHTEASLLHRIMEKAQHYTIIHVDATIANIQRTFSFNNISIYDAFQEIAKEIGCLFVLHSNSDENGKIQRTISVYDLESYCDDCKHRGEFVDVCPQCGSTNIYEGYGEDTTIFVTSDELADGIQLTADVGSIKNCFKLEAGDDLMTATIINCNPNGTDYLWYISDSIKSDMSPELVEKLESYDDLYTMYQTEYQVKLSADLINSYNNLVDKYRKYNDKLESIKSPIIGYPALMNAYYNTIDLSVYLQSTLMPTVTMIDTDAEKEVAKLTVGNLSPVAITNIEHISVSTANSAILAMAKTVIDSRYRIKVETSYLDSNTKIWTGNFNITSYSNEEDSATSETISIIVNDDYSTFVQQKIHKALKQDDTDNISISGLFALEQSEFDLELQKYSLNCLNSFYNSCQTCIDILIEQGIADNTTWSGKDPNLYNDLYLPYIAKMSAIEKEVKLRQQEIDLIIGVYDENKELKIYGLQNYIVDIKDNIQKSLNFQNYVSSELWLEFCSFRREDKYSNTNYISDGLNNAELFDKANEFINVARNEIYKSSELQHSISSTLKNLLVIDKFKPLVEYFVIGNWLRIMVDDELYKLRLIKYSIDYDDISKINVEFSDVVRANSTLKSIQDVISQAATMATSYNSVQRQAQQGEKSNTTIRDWVTNGLDVTATKIIGGADNQTQTWDEHGMVFRKYDSIIDEYDEVQLKIINSTIVITDDNWRTAKTAIGEYYYFDPSSETPNKLIRAYGVNAETIVGKLILGESLGIYNNSGSLKFDNNGFTVSNGINTVTINPNSSSIFNIKKNDKNVISLDNDGNLVIIGDIIASNLTLLDDAVIDSDRIAGLSDVAFSGSYKDLEDAPDITSYITTDGVIGSNPSKESTGFTVSKDGLLQASNAIIYGTLYSSNGVVGGWNIGNNSLYNGTENMTSTNVGTYIGIDGIRQYANNNAYVDIKNGIVKAVGGDFSGGTITGSTINGGTITGTNIVSYHPLSDEYYEPIYSQLTNGEFHMHGFIGELDFGYDARGAITINTPWFVCNSDGYMHITAAVNHENGEFSVDRLYSNSLDVYGNVNLCKNGGTVIVYPQAATSEGGEIMLCHAGVTNWTKLQDSVNIDNLNRGFRVYLYDDDGTGHSINLYKDGTFNVEKFTIGGVKIEPNTLSHASGVSCYFTYNDDAKHFRPPNDGLVRLGTSGYRWSEVWCTQSSLNSTSDERMKNIDGEIQYAEELIRAIHPIQYKFVNGESGRTHYGFGSQTFKNDLINVGLDPNKIATFLCDVTEDAKENGITLDTATEDEKIYGLRYGELIAPIVCVVQKLLNRVDELEKLLNKREV